MNNFYKMDEKHKQNDESLLHMSIKKQTNKQSIEIPNREKCKIFSEVSSMKVIIIYVEYWNQLMVYFLKIGLFSKKSKEMKQIYR